MKSVGYDDDVLSVLDNGRTVFEVFFGGAGFFFEDYFPVEAYFFGRFYHGFGFGGAVCSIDVSAGEDDGRIYFTGDFNGAKDSFERE